MFKLYADNRFEIDLLFVLRTKIVLPPSPKSKYILVLLGAVDYISAFKKKMYQSGK